MSKTIEFIEKEIEKLKGSIEFLKLSENTWVNQNGYDNLIFKRHRIEEQEKLQFYEQIKAELEAWGVVKPNIVEEDNIIDRDIKVIKVKCQLYPKGESNGKYEKLKKAIEVE